MCLTWAWGLGRPETILAGHRRTSCAPRARRLTARCTRASGRFGPRPPAPQYRRRRARRQHGAWGGSTSRRPSGVGTDGSPGALKYAHRRIRLPLARRSVLDAAERPPRYARTVGTTDRRLRGSSVGDGRPRARACLQPTRSSACCRCSRPGRRRPRAMGRPAGNCRQMVRALSTWWARPGRMAGSNRDRPSSSWARTSTTIGRACGRRKSADRTRRWTAMRSRRRPRGLVAYIGSLERP
jgi:hypothetical protein